MTAISRRQALTSSVAAAGGFSMMAASLACANAGGAHPASATTTSVGARALEQRAVHHDLLAFARG